MPAEFAWRRPMKKKFENVIWNLMEQYCQDNGCYFVNVAPIFKNEQGGLKAEFCLDYYVHLNNAGVEAWIAYLKAYAAGLHQ